MEAWSLRDCKRVRNSAIRGHNGNDSPIPKQRVSVDPRSRPVEQDPYVRSTTSLMVVTAGKIAYSYGDLSRASCLASVRKSILSMLYVKYVPGGLIDLNLPIGELGIDEGGEGLLPIEKSASVQHLLMSSSGVYWPAGSPGGNEATPARGSKKPGSYFLYNNWDFNVAAAVFQKLTGKSVFQALEEAFAGRCISKISIRHGSECWDIAPRRQDISLTKWSFRPGI